MWDYSHMDGTPAASQKSKGNDMATIEQTHKAGSTTNWLVTGMDRDTLDKADRWLVRENGDAIEVHCTNKREVAHLQQLVREASAPAATKAPAAGSRRRYVELHSRAAAAGLNHGRAWTCGEIDIETKGALPEWEDLAICYVYD